MVANQPEKKMITSDQFIEHAQNQDEISIDTLPVGTKFIVRTTNSTYDFAKTAEPNICAVRGGYFGNKSVVVYINGSTLGGSMLWMKKIDTNMILEMGVPSNPEGKKVVTTSWIQSISVVR